MADETIAIDGPQQIEMYRRIATLHGLRMEIAMQEKHGFPPTACPTRGRALGSAKRLLQEHGITPRRTRKQVLEQLEEWMEEAGAQA